MASFLRWTSEYLRIKVAYPITVVLGAISRPGQSREEKAIRSYFLGPRLAALRNQGVALLAAGCTLAFPFLITWGASHLNRTNACSTGCLIVLFGVLFLFGAVLALIGGLITVGSGSAQTTLGPQASQSQIREWLKDWLATVVKQSVSRLGLVTEEIEDFHSYQVLTPVLRPTLGISQGDLLWRVDSGSAFFGVYKISALHFADHHLGIYSCDYNFIRNIALNECTYEVHYQDISSFATVEEASAYTLPTGKKMTSSQRFILTLIGGEQIGLGANESQLRSSLRADSVPETETEFAISAIRTLLRDKKRQTLSTALPRELGV